MGILCISPQKMSDAKIELDGLYRSLPEATVVYSYYAALDSLRTAPFRFSHIVTTYTPDILLSDERKNRSSTTITYDYASGFIDELFRINPLAQVVFYSGAFPEVAERTFFRLRAHQVGWVRKDWTSEDERRQVLQALKDLSREYRIELDEDDSFRIVEGSNAPPALSHTEQGTRLLIRPLIRHAALFEINAVPELEHLLNSPRVSEREFQLFFEKHPQFLLGDRYRSLHSQVVLRREPGGEGDLIPDFILEPVNDSDFWKIVELKRPDETIIKRSNANRIGFSAQLQNALYQLRTYRDYFDNPINRTRMAAFGINAFKPQVSLVIGRDYGGLSAEDVITAKLDYKDLEVLTYSELLNRAKSLRWLV
jgi:hypothetical protein